MLAFIPLGPTRTIQTVAVQCIDVGRCSPCLLSVPKANYLRNPCRYEAVARVWQPVLPRTASRGAPFSVRVVDRISDSLHLRLNGPAKVHLAVGVAAVSVVLPVAFVVLAIAVELVAAGAAAAVAVVVAVAPGFQCKLFAPSCSG